MRRLQTFLIVLGIATWFATTTTAGEVYLVAGRRGQDPFLVWVGFGIVLGGLASTIWAILWAAWYRGVPRG